MILSKCAEIFAEAIPAGVLQMYAFVMSPNRSFAAAGSIIISALTTGFGSALSSYGKLIIRYDGVSIMARNLISNSLSNFDHRYGHLAKEETRDT